MKLRRIIGKLGQWLHPSCTHCRCCGIVWVWTKPHKTTYTWGRSCFPLCEHCWQCLTIDERLPYYRQLWMKWVGDAPDKIWLPDIIGNWPEIEAAVKAGL